MAEVVISVDIVVGETLRCGGLITGGIDSIVGDAVLCGGLIIRAGIFSLVYGGEQGTDNGIVDEPVLAGGDCVAIVGGPFSLTHLESGD